MTKPKFQRKRLHSLLYAVVFLSSILVNAGSQGATITNDQIHGFYDPSLVQYVVSKGSLPVVVIANPFGPDKDFYLLNNIALPGYYPTTVLSRILAEERDDGHLIMIFNPITSASGINTCLSPPNKTTTSGSNSLKENLHLLIAFCYDKEIVSEAYLEIKHPSTPTDLDFKKAMTQLFNVLLPIEKLFLGSCQDVDRGNC